MFENLKAARAANLSLISASGRFHPRTPWVVEVFFKEVFVGTLTGSPLARTLTLSMAESVEQQIIDALSAQGFQLNLSRTPRYSIHPDNPHSFIRLALVQIADELELLAELQLLAVEQTLVILKDNSSRVAVFNVPFSDEVKAKILGHYQDQVVEFINESIKGL